MQRRATPEEIRRAYHDLARVLHPDRLEGRMGPERVGAERRMQEINEAWRILRDPGSRAAYDQSLGMRAAKPPRPQGPPSARADDDDDLDFDTPFQGKPAEPGDLTVSVARALPWLVIAVVLGAIFIFTAFARHSTSEAPKPSSLIGQCITSSGGGMVAVPCAGPNDGKVIDVEPEASACPSGSSARSVSAKEWMCLEPVAQGATGTTSP